MAKKLLTTIYATPEQLAALRALSERTRVPLSEYVREGIDQVIADETVRLTNDSDTDEDDQNTRRA